MKFPTVVHTSALRAWSGGILATVVFIWLPFASLFLRLPMPFAAAFYLTPLGFALLAVYAMTVRPRPFAASGALLGLVPYLAWGVLDGLLKCARFNRPGSAGGCEADPTAQVALTAVVYVAALLATALAARSSTTERG